MGKYKLLIGNAGKNLWSSYWGKSRHLSLLRRTEILFKLFEDIMLFYFTSGLNPKYYEGWKTISVDYFGLNLKKKLPFPTFFVQYIVCEIF